MPNEDTEKRGVLAFPGCLLRLEGLRCKEKLLLLLNAAGMLEFVAEMKICFWEDMGSLFKSSRDAQFVGS